jgi:membrane complex biogenesis BtpA family protein
MEPKEDHRARLEFGPGHRKAIVAGVHLLPLPGSPAYDRQGGMRPILDRVRIDVRILSDHDVDAILFANEADTPYLRSLGPETIAAFTDAVVEATRDLALPFGINALLDPAAGIAIAHATGATFVRGYFTGVYATESGLMDTSGAEALRLRSSIGAGGIRVFHNLVCAFGAHIAPRPIGQEARGALVHGRVDGFTISGQSGGLPPAVELFREVKEAVPNLPVLAGTAVNGSNVRAILRVADGAIVVSSLREDGRPLNPLDPDRVRAFMDAVRESDA